MLNRNDNKDSRNHILTIIIYILYMIIVPFIIYDVIFIIKTILNPNKTPDIMGIKTFSIVSESMQPTINVNDIVIVKDSNDYHIEDIITFTIDNETITHRIINAETDENGEYVYTTKGDNNDVADVNKIKINQIEGKYIFKIPKIGKIFNILKNKFIFETIIIVLLIILYIERKKTNKKMERKVKRVKFENKKRLQLK